VIEKFRTRIQQKGSLTESSRLPPCRAPPQGDVQLNSRATNPSVCPVDILGECDYIVVTSISDRNEN
jgi:hypothetical protein